MTYNAFINDVRAEIKRELTLSEIRALQVEFYIEELTNGDC